MSDSMLAETPAPTADALVIIHSVRVYRVESDGSLTRKYGRPVDVQLLQTPQQQPGEEHAGITLNFVPGSRQNGRPSPSPPVNGTSVRNASTSTCSSSDDDQPTANASHTPLAIPLTMFTDTARMGARAHVITYPFPDAHETVCLKFKTTADVQLLRSAIADVRHQRPLSVFAQRTDDSSALQYFQFYGYLSQQQNMMQDYVRTSTYQKAILGNAADFHGKIVLDVGAGSGILSFFALQAGARRVYAVEASSMAQYAQLLVLANGVPDRITVITGKIEEIELPQQVDVIVSEPMGYMLYNERMLETYMHAKKWLRPGGKMFPSRGDLLVAPFSDESLYTEQHNKANFWYQGAFYGVRIRSLYEEACAEYFRQPIVDTFDVRICMAPAVKHSVDFVRDREQDLHEIDIALRFDAQQTGVCHGLAFWFDVDFVGSQQVFTLSTAPTEPLTHWYQVRCLFREPLFVRVGQTMVGRALLVANLRQSYDVTIELGVEGADGPMASNALDLKNPYYRYTGPPAVPPGTITQSPSEAYWAHLDVQGARNAVNMVNGISVNQLGEVTMDANHIG